MKRILFIAPFQGIFPPMNGGLLRCVNLMNQLARHFQLTVLACQNNDGLQSAVNEFQHLKNAALLSTHSYEPKKDLFSFFPAKIGTALRYRFWNRSVKGPANENFLLMYPILKALLKKEKYDYVVLEEMSIMNLAKVVQRYQPSATVIYDVHNVNTILAKSSLDAKQISQKEYDKVEWTENNLTKFVSHVFTCSEHDFTLLSKMNNGQLKGMVVPNGVGVKALPDVSAVNEDAPVNILFCGSLEYAPNVEGLSWFYEKIWPIVRERLSYAKLLVIGSGVPDARLNPLKEDPSVTFIGKVKDVEPYYQQSAVSVVPLLLGSGTRLKVLEAMSKGTPIVSTTIGAEGINFETGKDIMIADEPDLFAQHVVELMKQKEKRIYIKRNARQLIVNHYDWNKIGEDLAVGLANF
jgi:polysaccharide biosynthesis protein PslH